MNKSKNIFAILALIVSSFATAHTGLQSSIPADGAMLTESPDSLELVFTEPVNLVQLKLGTMMGAAVDISFTPTSATSATYSIAIPELAVGHYKADWALLGEDGHKMEGSFDFMVHGEGSMPMGNGMMMDGSTMQMPMGDGSMMDQSMMPGMATEAAEPEEASNHDH